MAPDRVLKKSSCHRAAAGVFLCVLVIFSLSTVQAAVPVFESDNATTLADRVLLQEHRIYPMAVRWYLEERLKLTDDGRVFLMKACQYGGALISPGEDS